MFVLLRSAIPSPDGAASATRSELLHVIVAARSERDRDWVSELLSIGTVRSLVFHRVESGADAVTLLCAHPQREHVLLAGPVDDIDALGLVQQLTEPAGLTCCPVVVITPGTGREDGPALLRAGAQDYIGEDWLSPYGLARAIENAQVRWSTERDLRQREAALQSEIADRRRIEGELRTAKQRFEAALAASPVIVFDQDRSLRYTWIHNPPAGLCPSDFLGRRDTDILPRRRDGTRAMALKRLAMRGTRLRRHEVTVFHGGAERHYDLTLQPQYDAAGQVVGITGAAVDITDRLRAQAALRAGRRQLALAMQVGELAVGEVDYAARVLHLSPEMAQLMGLGDSAMTVPLSAIHRCFHPEDRDGLLQELGWSPEPAAVGGLDASHRIIRPDGQLRWLRLRTQVLFEGKGLVRQATRAVVVVVDITAEQDAAAALRRSEAFVRGVLNSLPQHVLVLDQHGVVQAVNESWETFVREHGGSLAPTAAGTRYLQVCRDAARQGDTGAAEIVLKLEALLAGEADDCVVEYAWQAPLGNRWLLMHARRPVGGPGIILTHVDITGRKQAEERLREAQYLMQTIIDGAGALVFAKDLQGRYFLTNRAWRERLGFDEEQASGATDDVVFGQLMAQVVRQSDQQVLATGQRLVAEETTVRDGQRITYLSTKFPLADANGHRYAVCGVATDITPLKQAQADLQARERELQTLADNVPDVLLRFDRQMRHVFVSAAIQPLTGRHPHEFLGRNCRELGMSSELCDIWERALTSAFADARPQAVDFTFESPTGTRHVAGRFVPEFGPGGRVDQVLGVLHDDTERKRADQDLRRRAQVLSRLAEASGLIHASLSCDEIARVLVDQAREIVGAQQAAVLLSFPDDDAQPLQVVSFSPKYATWRPPQGPPPQPARTPGTATDVTPSGSRPIRITGSETDSHPADAAPRSLLPNGPPIHGLLSVPLTGHRGESVGWVQLSERHEGDFSAEDEALLLQLAAIASTSFEKARLYGLVRQADHRKDEFIAILAHELRNPLAPIRNGLEILRRGGQLVASAARARDMMERQLAHLVRLVDDLLDISRISRGKILLRRMRITAQAVLEHALEASRPALEASGHRLTLEQPGEPLWIDGDLTRLAQVVSNLLNNAVKYTPSGGLITVRLETAGGAASICVSDNGAGISCDMLPRIFELFTQVGDTMGRAQGGLGIGLSLVKQLVELHGGQAQAFSDGVGRGSRFTVLLPLAPGGGAPAALPAPVADEQVPARRVLVVDDNVDSAESLAVVLRQRGHHVDTVHDGQQVLHAVASMRPQMVLLDLGLPGISGHEVARRVRSDPAYDETLLVALTGWGAPQDQRQSLAAGCDHHLTKPVDIAALEALLRDPQRNAKPGRATSADPEARSGTDASR